MRYIVGVDVGGTFTDCVVLDEDGEITVGKALSTPEDFSVGAVDAIREAAGVLGLRADHELLRSTNFFFHACTVGDNTLLTASGAITGLITTTGFADILQMMRGKITEGLSEAEITSLSALGRPQSIVPKNLIEEVIERIDYEGSVLITLDPIQATRVVESLVAKGVQSIAICLLWSISNDSHEKLLAKIIKEGYPSIFLSVSSQVAPYLGEYERTATTVINAYIGPKISAYLVNLQRKLNSRGFKGNPLIMQAYGGVLDIEATTTNAIGTIESGPASGVLGSQLLGKLLGEPNILATDMGGTTFKVSVIREGDIERDYKPVILRYNILSTKIWVESIGAGGGSIARIDPETGLLKVGPQGAGAKPGPVCYGLGGTEPTVSDADLILGYLNEDYFLGGRVKLNKMAAVQQIKEKIAEPLGISVLEAASGIHRIANSHMSDLIRKATVERGYDPRKFILFAYGGAGPVHAGRYAAELGIKQVVVPLTASVHGATGLISSDVVYEYGKSEHLLVPADVERVNANFRLLSDKALADLRAANVKDSDVIIVRSIDMRYRYQVHELNVPLLIECAEITARDMENVYARFDGLYEKSYGTGSGYAEAGREITTFRLTAIGKLKKPNIKRYPVNRVNSDSHNKGERKVYFEEYGDFVQTPIYEFDRMNPGTEIYGPAIIETSITTIVVNPTDNAVMDEFRNVGIVIGH